LLATISQANVGWQSTECAVLAINRFFLPARGSVILQNSRLKRQKAGGDKRQSDAYIE